VSRDLTGLGRAYARRFRNRFQSHPRKSLANHSELLSSFFAQINLGDPISDAAISDADDNGLAIGNSSDADERTQGQSIVRGGKFASTRPAMRERVRRNAVPSGINRLLTRT
jgi:formylglycine-generating enzyme required for sulfatase activity